MPSFSYSAVNGGGQRVSGVLTAENYRVALRLLEEQSLFPIQVREGVDATRNAIGWKRRIKPALLTTFYSQLADLLRAGVPMLRSLDVLSRQASQGALVPVLKELREDVAGGMGLGDAMGKHPNAFSPLQSSMVRAGEQGGFLEDVLQRIAVFSEKQDELRNKVRGALIYPCILVTVGIGVLVVLLTMVVPKLRQYLRAEDYNVLTHAVFGMADVLQHHYLFLLGGICAVMVAVSAGLKSNVGKRWFERFKLQAPVMGKVLTMVAICRFCRILGTLLHNGVPILSALKIAKDSAGNEILAELIDQAGESVRKGAALSQPLGESGLFPPTVLDMISVAEESNNLETVLVQIADTNETRTARNIDLAVRVLEPLLLVAMAVMVACIMIALLIPMFSMGGNL